MARSPYENVFFYFRGPSAKGADDAQRARQVEDNTTKALINLLQLSSPALTKAWLEHLGIDGDVSDAPYEYYLQSGPAATDAPQRRLVVITAGDDAAAATWEPSAAERGRIDAAIHAPHQLLVAIEAKVGASLDGGQLKQHASDWGIAAADGPGAVGVPDAWIFTTWRALYLWGRDIGGQSELTPVDAFLITQFTEYLEIIGLTPFAGFRNEDFELLVQRRRAGRSTNPDAGLLPDPGDPAHAAAIKARVGKLWDAILPRLDPAERNALGTIHVGSLRAVDDRMWAASNWGEGRTNFTFELDPDQLELDLVAWTQPQAALFRAWLESDGAGAALAKLDGWSLVVWRRRAIADKSGKPYWMHNTYRELERIPMPPPADMDARLERHEAGCETGWELLAFHLRHEWPRETVLSAGEALVDEAVTELKLALPLLRAVNGRSSRSHN